MQATVPLRCEMPRAVSYTHLDVYKRQALSNLLGFDESKFKITTGIAGGVGTLLAAFGLLSRFEAFLSLMRDVYKRQLHLGER